MACAFQENSCNIGVICGTGSNACYMERIDKIPKIGGEVDPEKDGLPNEVHSEHSQAIIHLVTFLDVCQHGMGRLWRRRCSGFH